MVPELPPAVTYQPNKRPSAWSAALALNTELGAPNIWWAPCYKVTATTYMLTSTRKWKVEADCKLFASSMTHRKDFSSASPCPSPFAPEDRHNVQCVCIPSQLPDRKNSFKVTPVTAMPRNGSLAIAYSCGELEVDFTDLHFAIRWTLI